MLAKGSNLTTDWKNTWKWSVKFYPFQDRGQWPAEEENLGLDSAKSGHQEFPDKFLLSLYDYAII